MIANGNRLLLSQVESLVATVASGIDTTVERVVVGSTDTFVVTPSNPHSGKSRIFLGMHGGGLILGGGDCCRAIGELTARRFGMRTWALDCRMPPDDPYPAGLDDVLAAYRTSLELRPPEQIVVGG